jgi:hypothetical protein
MKFNCTTCSKEFEIQNREYKRQTKKGRTEFFCSRTCAAIKNNKDNPRPGNPENLRADNRRDEYTPFRWYVLRSEYRDRNKGYGCNLTVEYLKSLWDLQKGICSFSNWSLILPQDSDGWLEFKPNNASLDRIDNSKGYVEGNVRYVALMANYARNLFSDEQLIDFCKAVVKAKCV